MKLLKLINKNKKWVILIFLIGMFTLVYVFTLFFKKTSLNPNKNFTKKYSDTNSKIYFQYPDTYTINISKESNYTQFSVKKTNNNDPDFVFQVIFYPDYFNNFPNENISIKNTNEVEISKKLISQIEKEKSGSFSETKIDNKISYLNIDNNFEISENSTMEIKQYITIIKNKNTYNRYDFYVKNNDIDGNNILSTFKFIGINQ